MRLLLDEQIPASVARALRDRGHDVVSVQERMDLRGLQDPTLFAVAQADRRALVTDATSAAKRTSRSRRAMITTA